MQPHPKPARRIAEALGLDVTQWNAASAGEAGLNPGLSIRVLGSLTLARNGTVLPTLPAGQRAVLGLLALAHGAPMRIEPIVDALWAQSPPVSAAAIVQTYVSRLRRVLDVGDPEAKSRLMRDATGYWLHVANDELDLCVFRRLVDDARQYQQAGEVGRACIAYEHALGLWRREPLADIDILSNHPSVIALADEHARVVLEYAEAAESSGRHEQALVHLRTLVARNPLDEAAQSRLIIALAGSSRQVEALEVFESLRRHLDIELGARPSPALRDAHAKVLRQQIGIPQGLSETQQSWMPLFQLPAALADFTGRATETIRLIDAITPCQVGVPLAVVSGPPGAGKTSLALHAAHTLRAQFPDGQLWVHLAGTASRPRDPGEVLGEMLRAMGVHGSAIPRDLPERAMCYRSRLAGHRILVVADDVGSAAQVRPLLPGTGGCALIATSRLRMEDLDGAAQIHLDVMTAQDATELLTRLIGEDRVVGERVAADRLVQACGALPLAIRIAGAKLAARPLWSLSTMTRKIASADTRLGELESGGLSVRASISSSYESLPERARRAFRLLALLGPADFAEWVVGALLDDLDAADVLDELTSRSLITALGADVTGEPRYRLHDLLRDFAAERLAEESTGVYPAVARLIGGWLQLATTASGHLPHEPYFPALHSPQKLFIVPTEVAGRLTEDASAWFTAERINLGTAVEQACQLGWLELARQLAAQQRAFQYLQHRHDDLMHLWRVIADHAERVGDIRTARYARIRVGASMVECGQAADAIDILDLCIVECDQDDAETLAFALEWRATCAGDLDDFGAARDAAECGAAVARRAGSRLGECNNLGILSSALAHLGRPDEAVIAGESSLAIAEDLEVPTSALYAMANLARTYTLIDQHERAVVLCLRGIELSSKLGDACGKALAYGLLGDAYQGLGRYQDAATVLLEALPIFRRHSSRKFHAVCLLKLGYAHEAMGSSEAVGYLEESLQIFTELRLPRKADQARQVLDRIRAPQSAAPQPPDAPLVLPSRAAGHATRVSHTGDLRLLRNPLESSNR